jgi:hypothetical protein
MSLGGAIRPYRENYTVLALQIGGAWCFESTRRVLKVTQWYLWYLPKYPKHPKHEKYQGKFTEAVGRHTSEHWGDAMIDGSSYT